MSTGTGSLPVPRPTHRSRPSATSITSSRSGESGSITPSSVSSRMPDRERVERPQAKRQQSSLSGSIPASSFPSASASTTSAVHPSVPSEPLPDSLVCRSTFTALEHSANTLKRLAKHVLHSSSAVMALLEQLENAEDQLMSDLGVLGRWLEGGYGVTGEVWDAEGGIRKVAKQKRAREREELEVMVGHSLEAVKGEIKRQGLAAGGHAGVKFEGVSKQFYAQTASYLQEGGSDTSDKAHAARAAHFDLARYNYHSMLLHNVPPSSVGCLDLLVSLYSWVGAQLCVAPSGEQQAKEDDFARLRSPDTPTQRGRQLAVSETPVRLLLRDNEEVRGSVCALSKTLSLSLAHIAQVRVDLLGGWAERDSITMLLEERAKLLGALSPESTPPLPSPSPPDLGIRYDKPKKKIGGKIRGLFSSSNTPAPPPSSLAERAPPVSSSAIPPTLVRKSMDLSRMGSSAPSSGDRQGRASMHISRQRSPFGGADAPSRPRAEVLAETSAKLNGASAAAETDEEQRDLVGRKKEGVLWGTGAWEVLDKQGGKGKWERFYVVLAHSNLYEYRDHPSKPDTAAAVIDLKFASVREGRGTDRRFVFEIVTASHGRRLYQALSEAEMKTWIFAILNAIESCINGTSTIRSSDRVFAAESDKDRRQSSTAPQQEAASGHRHSLPAAPQDRRKRRTSLKNRLKGAAVDKSTKRGSVDLERRPQRQSFDGRDIERRVHEMVGISAGSSPVTSPLPLDSTTEDEPELPKLDMAMLKRIAGTGANQYCADCGRPNKSSRWATLSLREVPMVLFLCIRCVGVHRGLGTHISKPRSVDLDNWSPETILLAQKWGNERGNGVWERLKPAEVEPADENMAEYIRHKYVDGLWLSVHDKAVFGIAGTQSMTGQVMAQAPPPAVNNNVGRAL